MAASTPVVDGAMLPQPETQFGFTGLALDAAGNLYIADGGQSQLYRIAPDGTFTVIAGTGTYADTGDGGPATQAALKFPWGLYVDASGAIYVSDPDANRIRIITPDGMINAFAGTGKAGFAGDAGPAARRTARRSRITWSRTLPAISISWMRGTCASAASPRMEPSQRLPVRASLARAAMEVRHPRRSLLN